MNTLSLTVPDWVLWLIAIWVLFSIINTSLKMYIKYLEFKLAKRT